MRAWYPLIILLCCITGLFLTHGCSEAPRCNDGIQNGDETQVDCGGTCPVCYTCEDGYKNQNETDVDCGGACQRCLDEWQIYETNLRLEVQHAFFVDQEVGYLGNYEQLFRTTNGGKDWSPVTIPAHAGGTTYLSDVLPVSREKCFLRLTGNVAILYLSENGGQTWEPTQCEVLNYDAPSVLQFFDAHIGVLMQYAGQYDARFWRTTDGGRHWTQVFQASALQPSPFPGFPDISCYHMQVFPSGKAIAMGRRWRFVSTDFGQTWTPYENTVSGAINPKSVFWADENNGTMRGQHVDDPEHRVFQFKTTDGGATWTELFPYDYGSSDYLSRPDVVLPLSKDTLLHYYFFAGDYLIPGSSSNPQYISSKTFYTTTNPTDRKPYGRINTTGQTYPNTRFHLRVKGASFAIATGLGENVRVFYLNK